MVRLCLVSGGTSRGRASQAASLGHRPAHHQRADQLPAGGRVGCQPPRGTAGHHLLLTRARSSRSGNRVVGLPPACATAPWRSSVRRRRLARIGRSASIFCGCRLRTNTVCSGAALASRPFTSRGPRGRVVRVRHCPGMRAGGAVMKHHFPSRQLSRAWAQAQPQNPKP